MFANTFVLTHVPRARFSSWPAPAAGRGAPSIRSNVAPRAHARAPRAAGTHAVALVVGTHPDARAQAGTHSASGVDGTHAARRPRGARRGGGCCGRTRAHRPAAQFGAGVWGGGVCGVGGGVKAPPPRSAARRERSGGARACPPAVMRPLLLSRTAPPTMVKYNREGDIMISTARTTSRQCGTQTTAGGWARSLGTTVPCGRVTSTRDHVHPHRQRGLQGARVCAWRGTGAARRAKATGGCTRVVGG